MRAYVEKRRGVDSGNSLTIIRQTTFRLPCKLHLFAGETFKTTFSSRIANPFQQNRSRYGRLKSWPNNDICIRFRTFAKTPVELKIRIPYPWCVRPRIRIVIILPAHEGVLQLEDGQIGYSYVLLFFRKPLSE